MKAILLSTCCAIALGIGLSAPAEETMKAPDKYGYYIFLGLGDFAVPKEMTGEWTSRWDLAEWKRRIDRFHSLGTNMLFVYLMGHRLPYASQAFPGCTETDHPNVRKDLFQEVLDHCAKKGIEVTAVFTTTGHAGAYATAHPELAVLFKSGKRSESILCHHQEGGRRYPMEVIRECLMRYKGFNGVIMHPPEFSNPCYCAACKAAFRKAEGSDLDAAPVEEAKRFFMETNLRYQKEVLEAEARKLLPKGRQLTFTIPWIFETHFEKVAKEIDAKTVIVDWDYTLSEEAIAKVGPRLTRYQQYGHTLWFMPTCSYDFALKRDEKLPKDQVIRQIKIARESGVRDIVHFMGPVWWPGVEETSWPSHAKAASSGGR